MAGAVIQRMGQALAHHADAQRTDAELLGRFINEKDEAAFAVLVRRYGRFVHAVCRRMLRQHADAEDATQAVFVVLMRRADSVRHPEIAGWLHGVAVRVCLAQRKSAGRHRFTTLTAEPFATEPSADQREIAAILDEELSALPSKYRSAMIECDVLERSRSDAAKVLGWPEGTVATRLAKARQLLADKLRQRGVTLTVTALSVGLGSRLSAMPTPWDVPTMTANFLANGVLRTMSYSNSIWRSVAVFLALGTIGSAVMLAPAGDPSVEKEKGDSPLSVKPKAKVVPMVWKEREPIKLDGWLAGSLSFSADGKKLLVGGTEGYHAMFDAKTGKSLSEPKRGIKFAAVAFFPTGEDYLIGSEEGVAIVVSPEQSKSRARALWSTRDKMLYDTTPYNIAIYPPIISESAVPAKNVEKITTQRFIICNAYGYNVLILRKTHHTDGTIRPQSGPSVGLDTGVAKTEVVDEYALPLAVDPTAKWVVCNKSYDRFLGHMVLWVMPAEMLGKGKALENTNATVVCAAWSKDGSTIVTGDAEGNVIVWDAKTFKETKRFSFGKDRICSVDVTADGKRIAAATTTPVMQLKPDKTDYYAENTYVWAWKNPPETFKPIAPPEKMVDPNGFHGVASIKFTPDGKTLAACFCNFEWFRTFDGLPAGQVRIWDLKPKQ